MKTAFKSIMIFLVGVLAGVVGHKYAGRKYRSNFDGGQVINKSSDIQSLIEPNTIFGIDLSWYTGKVKWNLIVANKNIKSLLS
jgi:hypothetical protein